MLRIALWSTPRTVSTALLRSFVNRTDVYGVDEPFYAEYLKQSKKEHPLKEEVLAAGDVDLEAAAKEANRRGRTLLVEKHMVHHLSAEMPQSFFDERRHVFLIRDPREMIPSMLRDLGQVDASDLGHAAQADLFRRIPGALVVDSKDLLSDPEATLRRLCRELGIRFKSRMLKWKAGRHPCYGVWAPFWYKNLEQSTGFLPWAPKEAPFPEEGKALLEEALPFYEEMYAHRLC